MVKCEDLRVAYSLPWSDLTPKSCRVDNLFLSLRIVGGVVFLLAHVPWYEFWRHGFWALGHWTQMHASWWVWFWRAYFVVGTACAILLLSFLASERGRIGWRGVGFATVVYVGAAVLPVVGLPAQLLALIAPFLSLYVLLGESVPLLKPAGRGRRRIEDELGRIGVHARVESEGETVRITLWKPFRLKGCKRIVGWEGTRTHALEMLEGLPSKGGQSSFFAAFQIAPGEGEFAKLAEELDRLGVSQASTKGRSSWVEATYDPLRVEQTTKVLLRGVGLALDNPPGWRQRRPPELRSFDSLDSALAALARLPDNVGPTGFWFEVGE